MTNESDQDDHITDEPPPKRAREVEIGSPAIPVEQGAPGAGVSAHRVGEDSLTKISDAPSVSEGVT